MPDLDPTPLQTAETPQTFNPSVFTSQKPNASSSSAAAPSKATKADKDKGQQRIEIEPIYTSLKANIGEKWTEYKEAVGLFVLGQLNQSELCLRIDHLISYSPETEHLHNCLISTLFANCHREPPEPGVAPWVAANDKPSTSMGGSGATKGGDKIEERLRREVMALPPRDRRRLKEIGEREAHDPNASYPITSMNDYRIARSIKLPDSVPASAGGLNKTNWDLEIRKRYNQPLSHETLEFPDSASIQHRMLPMCYEEGLPNGAAEACPDFMVIATEMFIKDVVTSLVSLTRSNFLSQTSHASTSSVLLNGQQSQLVNGAAAPLSGKGPQRHSSMGSGSYLGSLNGRPLSITDMKVALSIGGCNLGQMPDIATSVMSSWPEGVLEGWDGYDQELDLDLRPYDTVLPFESHHHPSSNKNIGVNGTGKLLNGANGVTSTDVLLDVDDTNGVNVLSVLSNGVNDWRNEPAADGWAGSSGADRQELFDALDQCLNL